VAAIVGGVADQIQPGQLTLGLDVRVLRPQRQRFPEIGFGGLERLQRVGLANQRSAGGLDVSFK